MIEEVSLILGVGTAVYTALEFRALRYYKRVKFDYRFSTKSMEPFPKPTKLQKLRPFYLRRYTKPFEDEINKILE